VDLSGPGSLAQCIENRLVPRFYPELQLEAAGASHGGQQFRVHPVHPGKAEPADPAVQPGRNNGIAKTQHPCPVGCKRIVVESKYFRPEAAVALGHLPGNALGVPLAQHTAEDLIDAAVGTPAWAAAGSDNGREPVPVRPDVTLHGQQIPGRKRERVQVLDE